MTEHGITFRDRAADGSLVGAVVEEPGEGEASLTVTLPDAPVRISTLCSAAAGTAVRVDLGPVGVFRDRSCTEHAFDPGGTYLLDVEPGELGRPRDEVTLRIRVAGDPSADQLEDVLVGLGVYALDPPAARWSPCWARDPTRSTSSFRTHRRAGACWLSPSNERVD